MRIFLWTLYIFRAAALLGAAAVSAYGFMAAGEPGTLGYWRLAYAMAFVLSMGLLWALARSFQAFRRT